MSVLVGQPDVEFLGELFILDEVGHLEELAVEVHFEKCQGSLLDGLVAVHHQLKVTLLDVVRLLSLPYLSDILNLVTLVEIKQLNHKDHNGLSLDTIPIDMARLQVVKYALVLQVAKE